MTEPDLTDLIGRYATAATLESLPKPVNLGTGVPPNPPEEIQVKFVGLSYERAFAEAASFINVVDGFAVKHLGGGIATSQRIIDFGSGWGRISRILLSQTSAERIYALDVDLDMTALVNSTLPGVNAMTISPEPPTVLATAMADAAVAFSVFSHLSGPAHEMWATELARLVTPGGFMAITVLDEAFFNQVAGVQEAAESGTIDEFAAALASTFPDVEAARSRYHAGEIQYAAVGGGEMRSGEYYGWAVSPSAYIERVWGAAGFQILEWVPSGVLFEQALVFMVRREYPPLASDGSSLRRLADKAGARSLMSRARWQG